MEDTYSHICRQGTGLWLVDECLSSLGNYNFHDLFGTRETGRVLTPCSLHRQNTKAVSSVAEAGAGWEEGEVWWDCRPVKTWVFWGLSQFLLGSFFYIIIQTTNNM